jgi:hypothetical protein
MLATPYANITTVESDSSIVRWEKDEHRASLSDVSHLKQLCYVNFTPIYERMIENVNAGVNACISNVFLSVM